MLAMENQGATDLSKRKEETTVVADQIPGYKGTRRVVRYFPPLHYMVKVSSFSASADANKEAYECGMFEAGGHKWKLVLYPKGNKAANGSGFISLYLEIVETDELPPTNLEVNLIFKLFVLDQIRDKFLSVEDADGEVKRIFYRLKPRCGFSRFISLESFSEPTNGYLMDDCCFLGAEVSVFERSSLKVDCLSIIELTCNHSWKIEKFSKLLQPFCYSDTFTVGALEWRLKVYPKGNKDAEGKSLSVYLELVEASLFSPGQKKYVEFSLRVRNQAGKSHKHKEFRHWFSSTAEDWGPTAFIPLKELCDASNGYIVNDTVIVDATIDNV